MCRPLLTWLAPPYNSPPSIGQWFSWIKARLTGRFPSLRFPMVLSTYKGNDSDWEFFLDIEIIHSRGLKIVHFGLLCHIHCFCAPFGILRMKVQPLCWLPMSPSGTFPSCPSFFLARLSSPRGRGIGSIGTLKEGSEKSMKVFHSRDTALFLGTFSVWNDQCCHRRAGLTCLPLGYLL
jgi:hypothetical protein